MIIDQKVFTPRINGYAAAFQFPEHAYSGMSIGTISPQSFIEEQKMRCEETVIKAILKELLHREPIPEDAKKVTIARNINWNNKYQIAFDNHVLGWISKEFINHEYMVRFTPIN